MKTIYIDNQNVNILDDLSSGVQLDQDSRYQEYYTTIENENYGVNYLKYRLDDAQIEYFDVKYHRAGSQLRECKVDTLEMIFFIEGVLHIVQDDNCSEIVLPNRHNLCYTGTNQSLNRWKFDSEKFKVLAISLPKNILDHYPQSNSAALEHFVGLLGAGAPARLHYDCMTISTSMREVLKEIINCSKSETGKWIFLESKIQELLAMQLEQVLQPLDDSKYLSSPENIKKIYAIRNFMKTNLSSRLSLPELAKKVGTNTFNLKKGFKELYGTSVFAYWNTLRMDRAKKFLKEREFSIGEISAKLGFKSQHHFSSAFKKKFGITPTQMRKY